jgi:hypothetical protein
MSDEIEGLLGSGDSVIYPGLGGPAGKPDAWPPGAQPRSPAADPAQPPDAIDESDVDPQDGEPAPAADPQSRRYQRWRTISARAALGATALFVVLALVLPRLPHRAQPAAAPGHGPVRSSVPAIGEVRDGPEPSAASPSVTSPSVNASVEPASGEPSPLGAGAGDPAPFQPISYEAEAPENALSGSAVIQPYPGASGGTLVTDLGSTLSGAAPGTLTFTAVKVPATGRYTLVVSYLYVAPFSGTTSALVVTVAGSAPVTVPIPLAPQDAACCATTPVPVILPAGVDAITFGDPSGVAPAIDRIVVTR